LSNRRHVSTRKNEVRKKEESRSEKKKMTVQPGTGEFFGKKVLLKPSVASEG